MKRAFTLLEIAVLLTILLVLGAIIFYSFPHTPAPTPAPDIIADRHGEEWREIRAGDIVVNRDTGYAYFFLRFEDNESFSALALHERHTTANPILPIGGRRAFNFTVIPRGTPESPNPEWLETLDTQFRRFVPDHPRDE